MVGKIAGEVRDVREMKNSKGEVYWIVVIEQRGRWGAELVRVNSSKKMDGRKVGDRVELGVSVTAYVGRRGGAGLAVWEL